MKIRVLEVLATLKRAGAERVAVALACRLDPSRFETAGRSGSGVMPINNGNFNRSHAAGRFAL